MRFSNNHSRSVPRGIQGVFVRRWRDDGMHCPISKSIQSREGKNRRCILYNCSILVSRTATRSMRTKEKAQERSANHYLMLWNWKHAWLEQFAVKNLNKVGLSDRAHSIQRLSETRTSSLVCVTQLVNGHSFDKRQSVRLTCSCMQGLVGMYLKSHLIH